jgi:hypothetical protein
MINFLRYLLCLPDCIDYRRNRSRNPRSSVELRQFPRRENACCDQQNALSTFIHLGGTAW